MIPDSEGESDEPYESAADEPADSEGEPDEVLPQRVASDTEGEPDEPYG
jgi:hypothetical protein